MRITAIQGSDPDIVADGCRALLAELELAGRVSVEGRAVYLRDLRLRELVPHYYHYYNPRNPNWYVERNDKGKLVVKHSWGRVEYPIRRGRFLQWRHWATLDNNLNEFLDSIGAIASIRSAYGTIRHDGDQWDRVCPLEYTIEEA